MESLSPLSRDPGSGAKGDRGRGEAKIILQTDPWDSLSLSLSALCVALAVSHGSCLRYHDVANWGSREMASEPHVPA